MKEHLYVWFDTEYSSLDLESAVLLQAAALITDTSLMRVLPPEHDVRMVIQLPKGIRLSSWVRQNLRGLLRQCRSSEAMSIGDADDRLRGYVDMAAVTPVEKEGLRPVLAGNSVHADWLLARRFLPHFVERLHYRQLDVTAFKLEWLRHNAHPEFKKENPDMVREYFPQALLSVSDGRHDAYYDVQASVAELAFYRRHLFR